MSSMEAVVDASAEDVLNLKAVEAAKPAKKLASWRVAPMLIPALWLGLGAFLSWLLADFNRTLQPSPSPLPVPAWLVFLLFAASALIISKSNFLAPRKLEAWQSAYELTIRSRLHPRSGPLQTLPTESSPPAAPVRN